MASWEGVDFVVEFVEEFVLVIGVDCSCGTDMLMNLMKLLSNGVANVDSVKVVGVSLF